MRAQDFEHPPRLGQIADRARRLPRSPLCRGAGAGCLRPCRLWPGWPRPRPRCVRPSRPSDRAGPPAPGRAGRHLATRRVGQCRGGRRRRRTAARRPGSRACAPSRLARRPAGGSRPSTAWRTARRAVDAQPLGRLPEPYGRLAGHLGHHPVDRFGHLEVPHVHIHGRRGRGEDARAATRIARQPRSHRCWFRPLEQGSGRLLAEVPIARVRQNDGQRREAIGLQHGTGPAERPWSEGDLGHGRCSGRCVKTIWAPKPKRANTRSNPLASGPR